MKISTKGIYGLEAILDIAINLSNGPVKIRSISERQGISDKYLEQIFRILKKNNLVNSIRGAKGGYVLSKSPQEMTVKEILDILEGPLSPVDCVVEGDCCNRFEGCATKIVWSSVREELDAITEAVTIADLVDCYQKYAPTDMEYYI